MSSDSLNSALTQIATLLRKYQRDVWADRALEVQGVLGQQGVKEALLATSRWWGGMGSMNDNYLCSIDSATLFAAGIPSIESAEEHRDNGAFRSALAPGVMVPQCPSAKACFATPAV